MKILADLVSSLDLKAEVRDIRVGPFQTAVLTSNCGLASTPHDYAQHQKHGLVREAGNLMDRGVLDLVRMAYSSSTLEAAIGMATINSLLEVDEGDCIEVNAADILAKEGEGKNITIVGHFPFVSSLRRVAKQLWVIERRSIEEDFGEEAADKLIPQAEVVGITGTAFINHTIEHLLTLCRHEAYVTVIGGSAPLSPVLFDYGVDCISGTKVVEPEVVMRCISQGATYRQIQGIRRLTMKK
ncbi:Rossmann-like domain-containing protein [Chloroflexota bacterium]